jgi:hypothetical protein
MRYRDDVRAEVSDGSFREQKGDTLQRGEPSLKYMRGEPQDTDESWYKYNTAGGRTSEYNECGRECEGDNGGAVRIDRRWIVVDTERGGDLHAQRVCGPYTSNHLYTYNTRSQNHLRTLRGKTSPKTSRGKKENLRPLRGLCRHVSLGTKVGRDEGAMNSTKRDEPGSASPLWDPEYLAIGSAALWLWRRARRSATCAENCAGW